MNMPEQDGRSEAVVVKPKRKWSPRKKFFAGAIAVVAVVIILAIIGGTGGSDGIELIEAKNIQGVSTSITLEELQQAIKAKKKVYTYILKDVYTENRIYEKNIAMFNFEPAYVDDIRIHQFISEFKKMVKNSPIHPFESVNEIISNLKAQFSGPASEYASSASASHGRWHDLPTR